MEPRSIASSGNVLQGSQMMAITHNEIRRHPRWREELKTPLQAPQVRTARSAGMLGVVAAGFLVLVAALVFWAIKLSR